MPTKTDSLFSFNIVLEILGSTQMIEHELIKRLEKRIQSCDYVK